MQRSKLKRKNVATMDFQHNMPKKPPRPNLARKRLKEIKRPVTQADGTTIRKSFYGQTLLEAQQRYLEHLNPPLQPNVREGTFAWWLIHKYSPLKAHRRPKTRENIQTAARHILSELGDEPVASIDATRLTIALERISEKTTCRNPTAKAKWKRDAEGKLVKNESGKNILEEPVRIYKPLSSSLINRCRLVALEVNELASEMDQSIRRINPKRVPIREEDSKEVDVYSPQEMRRLLEAARGSVAFLPALLYPFLGLTLNEALGLRCSDLIADGTLLVHGQAEPSGELIKKMKTKYRRREMPLPAAIVAEIRPFTFSGGRLIKGASGQPLRMDNVDRAIFAAMRRAGLRQLTIHELRHSFSSWLEDAGCPRSVRLKLMGQSTKAVAERYNHPTDDIKRAWLQKLWDASLAPAPNQASTEAVVNAYDSAAAESEGKSAVSGSN